MNQNTTTFALKGDIVYAVDKDHIVTQKDGYLVCEKGKSAGVFKELPAKYSGIKVVDHTGRLIVPGMTDLHVHAPQYTYRGIGMDLELLEWLNTHTFPEEVKYENLAYAAKAYSYFTYDLQRCFTTRAVVFATVHTDSTIELMDQLEASGMITYVGKVNMDRNSVCNLEEKDAETSLRNTVEWLEKIEGRYRNTSPIITPRFIPSCTDELMSGLGALAAKKQLRIQSHLSENPSEIQWVRELVPASTSYANAYEMFGAMGSPDRPTIMAHCVYSGPEEMAIMQKYGTFIAHCPESNMNLTSGIAPVRKFLDAGMKVGLGSDVAAGSSMDMLKTMLCTLQASKMYFRLVDNNAKALTFEEVFYLATKGGGAYFGKVGSFEKGYDFDAVVLDDSLMVSMREVTVRERVERAVYNDADCIIMDKYVAGTQIWKKQCV
ncbi:MAG: amidohydrolase family protein [bacterium]|nr:amidohydrolase family protein [bacterium]